MKIVLGGSSNADDLADLSRLIGDRDVPERSESVSGSARTVSTTLRPRPILQPSDIRVIGLGKDCYCCAPRHQLLPHQP